MNVNDLRIVAPDRNKDMEAICDLVAKVFRIGENYYAGRNEMREELTVKSHYDWSASRVGFIGDKMVSHYAVWDYQMRIGGAKVRVGGIGIVATHGEYRKMGIMKRTSLSSIQAMREAGYDMTMLFGLHNFYDKYGYVRAWSWDKTTVRLAELQAEKSGYALRKFNLAENDEAAKLYNRYHRGMTGTAVRPTWRGKHGRWNKAYKWTDEQGRMRGYVYFEPIEREHTMHCHEVVGDVDEAMGVIVKLMKKFNCDRVQFRTLPYCHPVMVRVRRGTCDREISYARAGSAMIRMINLVSALKKMSGELSKRLKGSAYADWCGKLTIADKWDRATLMIDRGNVSVTKCEGASKHAIIGKEKVVQLLIGTAEPWETVAGDSIRLTGDGKMLIDVLFPQQYPTLSTWDHY